MKRRYLMVWSKYEIGWEHSNRCIVMLYLTRNQLTSKLGKDAELYMSKEYVTKFCDDTEIELGDNEILIFDIFDQKCVVPGFVTQIYIP